MKTDADDMNDTGRAGGDEAVRARFDQSEKYHRSDGETQPKPEGPRANGQQGGWPEPDMGVLRLQRRDAPKLPIEILGERWARWIEGCAAAAACPADYVVAPLLAAASAVIGHARWPQASKSWIEPPHLWCVSVGDSGDGKSPGADVIYRTIIPEMERAMEIGFPERLREAQTAIKVTQAKHAKWESELKEAVEAGKTPPPQPEPIPEEPVAPRLVLSDVTVEQVAVLLVNQPKGVLMHRDEIAGFLLGMTQYNNAARPFWIEAFGGRSYRVDRVKHPKPIIIPRLAVAWHGGIQPERLAEVICEEPDDGLLARFMWFWPEPVEFHITERKDTAEWAVTCFDRLRDLKLAGDKDNLHPVMVPLTPSAVRRLEVFGQALQKRKETAAGLMRSTIGKGRGLILRLSLVLEFLHWCARDGYSALPAVITEETLIDAAKFVFEYVMPMAERTFGDAACTELDRNTATLARWVKEQRPDAVHVREMQRKIRLPGLTTADTIHATCKALVEAGWLAPSPGRGGQQRGKEAYPVSPRLEDALREAPQ
jgi:hypothetical protein